MQLREGEMVAVRLQATLEAARQARGAVESIPELERHEDLQFVTALLATELVSNAVKHAGLTSDDKLVLVAETDGDSVHVEVSDTGPGFFPLHYTRSRGGKRAEHGLHLVDVLADRWGFRRDGAGCTVWFDVDLVPGRRPWRGRVPCPVRDRGAGTP
jgi:anti-sigma regulatory factor (Ser/Thr protein kinase)